MHMLTRVRPILLLLMWLPLSSQATPGLSLPDLGGSTLGGLGSSHEIAIGRSIVNELRRQGVIVEDPELNEYIQVLGDRLAVGGNNGDHHYSFFLVKDDSINAFALPGGFIGVHTGLVTRTRTESELASVLAHEIAHVRQNHIARRYEANSGANLKTLGILLGAIAIAAAGGDSDDVAGAMMLGQGMAIQQQINFTRAQETEADRVGLGILARANFNPRGMVSFFQTMQQYERLQNSRLPEFLMTHPLSTTRVVEAAQRVQSMRTSSTEESRNYPLMHARVLGLYGEERMSAVQDLAAQAIEEESQRYLEALLWHERGQFAQSEKAFRELLEQGMDRIHYHIGLGRSLSAQDKTSEARNTFERALRLFPDNIPLNLAFADFLQRAGAPKEALKRLDDLFERRPPPVEAIRDMARLARETGKPGESHFYMSEYYLRTGQPEMARIQLQLATQADSNNPQEQKQYAARLAEITDALAEQRRNSRR